MRLKRISAILMTLCASTACSDYTLQKKVEYAPEIVVTPLEHDFGALNADGQNSLLDVLIQNNITGYLPAGHYKLELIAVDLNGESILSSYEEEIEYTLGDQFEILYPDDGLTEEELGNNFFFQWKTPGFRNGVKIEFRLIISAIIPEDADSPEDAIDLGYHFDLVNRTFEVQSMAEKALPF